MKYTKNRKNRKNATKKRKIVGGGSFDDFLKLIKDYVPGVEACLTALDRTDIHAYKVTLHDMFSSIFGANNVMYGSIFRYYPERVVKAKDDHGYPVTMNSEDVEQWMNPILVKAINIRKRDSSFKIYFAVVSSGGHSGIALIFFLDGRLHCILIGVSMYSNTKFLGIDMISIISPEYSLSNPNYYIITWCELDAEIFINIVELCTYSFYIKKKQQPHEEEPRIFYSTLTILPYNRLGLGYGFNCKTFASSVTSTKEPIFADMFTAFYNKFMSSNNDPRQPVFDVLRRKMQEYIFFPNRFLIHGIDVYIVLIKLAISNGVYIGKTTEEGFKTTLTLIYKRDFIPQDVSYQLPRESEEKINRFTLHLVEYARQYSLQQTSKSATKKSATKSRTSTKIQRGQQNRISTVSANRMIRRSRRAMKNV